MFYVMERIIATGFYLEVKNKACFATFIKSRKAGFFPVAGRL